MLGVIWGIITCNIHMTLYQILLRSYYPVFTVKTCLKYQFNILQIVFKAYLIVNIWYENVVIDILQSDIHGDWFAQ